MEEGSVQYFLPFGAVDKEKECLNKRKSGILMDKGNSKKSTSGSAMTGQSRKHSLLESCVNVAVGYLVAVGSQTVILPLFGIVIGLRESAEMALWFTGISIIRSYVLRRAFNRVTVRKGWK